MKEKKNKEDIIQAIQRYEIIYLISNKYSEDEVEPINQEINELFKNNGGIIITEENWGKRKLSYPINHFYHAYYYLAECDLPTSSIQKIDNILRLDEKILRHLIVQKRIKTEEEIIKEKKTAQIIAKEEKESKESTEISATSELGKNLSTDVKKKEKVDMVELDEKLDKILDDTKDLL